MGLKIEIDTGNDAFQGVAGEHCASLLHEVARKLDQGARAGNIYDGNGNKVGTYELDHTDAPES
ncbi:hypothetical protein HOU02_gp161 [Caulobacter phage CcrBL9]|uniref:Uncharacterized protein n=1 Tax=Caulobacter phage CcrBL9 TaxID=2283270 RepID=A0A385EE68_9CAUD|nr:hypothetical protein HOU02_gp024 [Caulobacter phage CcrBL9]YP_009810194.1 hypothetical protein HOU02_gp161 [Caulobacter phage CcrBL9]AXQ69048.1 hypothetical protein CcrBL9_gp024 [Caulobacter phage CcrBL9]AXQ69564.1 hypothetical protein CcrBL9_gp540 [Caulobacter phage CcrBL9]